VIGLPDHTLDPLHLRSRTCLHRFIVHHLSLLDEGAQALVDRGFNFTRFILSLAIISLSSLLWRFAFKNVRLARRGKRGYNIFFFYRTFRKQLTDVKGAAITFAIADGPFLLLTENLLRGLI